jgi:hypothetical protein
LEKEVIFLLHHAAYRIAVHKLSVSAQHANAYVVGAVDSSHAALCHVVDEVRKAIDRIGDNILP